MTPKVWKCAACGIALPNRYAVGGWGGAVGEDPAWCKRCARQNSGSGGGGREAATPRFDASESAARAAPAMAGVSKDRLQTELAALGEEVRDTGAIAAGVAAKAGRKLWAGLTGESAQRALALARRQAASWGRDAVGMVTRLREAGTPAALVREVDAGLTDIQARRAAEAAKVEALANRIRERKRVWEAAPSATRPVLEAELRTALTEYQARERTLLGLHERERELVLLASRLDELAAQALAPVKEQAITDLTDRLDEQADSREDRSAAVNELARAGAVRRPAAASQDLAAALAAFDTPAGPAIVPEPSAPAPAEPAAEPAAAVEPAAPISEPAIPEPDRPASS